MDDTDNAWEEWYRRNPRNWKGSPLPLPDLPKGARVLDVGCGTGSTMIQAVEMGFSVSGIDISRTAIDKARERLKARGHLFEVAVHDIRDGLGSFEPFDCIFMHHVLDSMLERDREHAVEISMNSLVDGGVISFQDYSVKDMRMGKGREIEKNTFLKGDGLMAHFFTLDEVRGLFSGMVEISLEEVSWKQSVGKRDLERSRITGSFQL